MRQKIPVAVICILCLIKAIMLVFPRASVQRVRDVYSGRYVLQADNLCEKDPFLLVVVVSSPKNYDQRKFIRGSWGREAKLSSSAEILFLVGLSDEHTNQMNIKEGLRYGDVVMPDVVDTYHNLTLKITSAFNWSERFCKNFSFLAKVDDDVFLQLNKLERMLRAIGKTSPHKSIVIGNTASGWKPVRNNDSKYFITEEQYKEEIYPTFVTGPSYVVSKEAVSKLVSAAWDEPYVHLEDVFFTGILAEKLGIPRRLAMELKNNAERVPNHFLGCTLMRSISLHKIYADEQKELLIGSKNPQCGP